MLQTNALVDVLKIECYIPFRISIPIAKTYKTVRPHFSFTGGFGHVIPVPKKDCCIVNTWQDSVGAWAVYRFGSPYATVKKNYTFALHCTHLEEWNRQVRVTAETSAEFC